MTAETYRARWISLDGEIVRDDTFEYDVEAHESANFTRPEARVGLALDAPYFDLRELHAHVDGYIETALIDRRSFVIVNEEGLLRRMRMAPHLAIFDASARYGQVLVGPVVLVERQP